MPRPARPVLERVCESFEVTNDCWEWTGSMHVAGYGQLRIDDRLQRAHRVVYELAVGPIPEGLTLDHLCRNRACVNPDHLEPVTIGENVRRGIPRGSKVTHCRKGHAYEGDNLIIEPSTGRRRCRICKLETQQRYREKATP